MRTNRVVAVAAGSLIGVALAIPLTMPMVNAKPMLSRTESPPSAQSQQAKISPAYWTGMKT